MTGLQKNMKYILNIGYSSVLISISKLSISFSWSVSGDTSALGRIINAKTKAINNGMATTIMIANKVSTISQNGEDRTCLITLIIFDDILYIKIAIKYL